MVWVMNCADDPKGMEALGRALQQCATLSTLRLSQNAIGHAPIGSQSMAAFTPLAEALKVRSGR